MKLHSIENAQDYPDRIIWQLKADGFYTDGNHRENLLTTVGAEQTLYSDVLHLFIFDFS